LDESRSLSIGVKEARLKARGLTGEVMSGNDWQSVRADSCIKLDVRLVLRTTDGAWIVMTYQCLRRAIPRRTISA
jgi:hypothetical protein